MPSRLLTVLFALVLAAPAFAAAGEVRVTEEKTFVYEQPKLDSPLVRRLFVGEVLTSSEEVVADDETHWMKVKLGEDASGYVRAERVAKPGTQPVKRWAPPTVVRDERPFVVGARVAGELPGAALNVRYQPFTRLGLSLTTGGVFDDSKWKGQHAGMGFYGAFVLWNLTPILEAGIAFDTYNSPTGSSTLMMVSYYTQAGLEWMFDWGGFVYVYGAYVHSLDIYIAHNYTDARDGKLDVGTFGALEPQDRHVFTSLRPGISFGYAF